DLLERRDATAHVARFGIDAREVEPEDGIVRALGEAPLARGGVVAGGEEREEKEEGEEEGAHRGIMHAPPQTKSARRRRRGGALAHIASAHELRRSERIEVRPGAVFPAAFGLLDLPRSAFLEDAHELLG